MDSKALEQIQTKIAFLESASAELSDVVFRQQQEIRALTASIKRLAERLRTLQPGDAERAPEDERPPLDGEAALQVSDESSPRYHWDRELRNRPQI